MKPLTDVECKLAADAFIEQFGERLYAKWRNGCPLDTAREEYISKAAFGFALSAGFGNALKTISMAVQEEGSGDGEEKGGGVGGSGTGKSGTGGSAGSAEVV
jgi:hypothetical protein